MTAFRTEREPLGPLEPAVGRQTDHRLSRMRQSEGAHTGQHRAASRTA
ncbi:hypothetical protein [Streptomyces capitiformicae]|uniref:Uncharacterized protein n=1 Tax=Streptomyces capitiformicae TaxID=2014920 RepID=A0A919DQD9_9ACTN|nr:hypothetical protein [Streptomyces capitiformicae]GHE67506.1 hypothetical protein GCM10017771_91280 [Streptomyces capitiformicae]